MDGFKKRLNESLQFRLSFSLSLVILAIALAAGVFSFASAFNEANELQDATLAQIAELLDRGDALSLAPPASSPTRAKDEETRVTVQMLLAPGPLTSAGTEQQALPIPPTLADGLHTIELDGEDFRVLVRTLSGGQRVCVAQETWLRDETARDSALRTLLPLLILVPVLLITVAKLVKKMFEPMEALAQEIDQRAEHDLHPVDASVMPSELRPFASAINRLLTRVAKAMEAQRRFLADAAHELRSPLAAMSLQSERLQQSAMSDDARTRLATLRQGIERGGRLLEQLLTLAKAHAAEQPSDRHTPVLRVYRDVIEGLMPLAEHKRIDLGVVTDTDAVLHIDPFDLFTMIRNLVDNAIRYTPDGGSVDLSVHVSDAATVLRVCDSGPGIPSEERPRVFAPFYRTLGTGESGAGLGLAIVKTIAERHGAVISLDHSHLQGESGLCVSIAFPPSRSA